MTELEFIQNKKYFEKYSMSHIIYMTSSICIYVDFFFYYKIYCKDPIRIELHSEKYFWGLVRALKKRLSMLLLGLKLRDMENIYFFGGGDRWLGQDKVWFFRETTICIFFLLYCYPPRVVC